MTEQILNCIGDCRVAFGIAGACIGFIIGFCVASIHWTKIIQQLEHHIKQINEVIKK